jgi:hypothetical protein
METLAIILLFLLVDLLHTLHLEAAVVENTAQPQEQVYQVVQAAAVVAETLEFLVVVAEILVDILP